jgi:hypothetical protein
MPNQIAFMRYFFLMSLLCLTVSISAQKTKPIFYLYKNLKRDCVTGALDCTTGKVVYSNCWERPVTPSVIPIVILDNKLSSYAEMQALDTTMIESVELLKADKATLLYGSRGVNGAIYIITKYVKGRVFKISDAEDNLGVDGATIMFIAGKDSIQVLANHFGEIQTDALKSNVEYGVRVTSVGYKDFITTYSYSQATTTVQYLLKRDVKENQEVIVKANGYSRFICRIGCGGVFADCALFKKEAESKEMAIVAKIYPNPVARGTAFKVEFDADVPKSLIVKIFNLGGAQLAGVSYQSIKGPNLIEVPVSSRWPAGIYAIQMIDHKGKLIQQHKIIIQ